MEQIAEFDDESSFFLNQIQTQTEKTINTRENSYHNPLRIVKCLLPKSIVRRYKENPQPQIERDIMKSPSAVLHIRVSIACSPKDISDPEIPEFKQMREVMNFVYEHVTYQGGDIIKEYSCLQFMEFSCIAVWNTENEDLSTVAQRAGNCALSLLHQHTEKQKDANKPSVTIKVGLDVGEVWYLSLGGYLSKWHYFVAGLPVKNAMIGATLAKGNDLISSPNAWRQIQENARGVPIHSDAQKIKSTEAASYYVIKSFDRNISKTVPFASSRSEGSMLGNSGNIDEESMKNRFETSLLSHIPRTLQFRLYSLSPSEGSAMTTNAWVPELRQITFLYMVLEDIAYEWEAAQRLSDIIYTCQWEFNHYGSCLDSVFVDGDKTVITCVWGLPTATFEDNAVRAITAARALQTKIRDQFSVKTRIGIAQGRMIYALTGSRNRYEQTLTGNASAISRSLAYSSSITTKEEEEEHDLTRILVDQSVFSESSTKVTFDESLPIEITVTDKWKHKLSAHRPLAVTQRDHNSCPNLSALEPEQSFYVIPNKEMDQITEKVKILATTNRGGLLYIEGPPGSGKSRLAFEIYKMSINNNLTAIMSSGHKYQQHTLFFPWRSIFADLLKLNGFASNSSSVFLRQNCVATVLNEVSPFALTYAPLLNPILSVNFPSNEYFHFFLQSTSQNRESRFDKLRDLLVALMEWVLRQQSVVLILDDAHWIDPSSWNLALTLLKKFSDAYGLLIVILTRPMNASLDQNVMKLLKLEDTVKLSLPPLTEKQSQELLARLLGVEAKTLPAPILKLVLQTQGVPLFINEIAHLIRTNENISIFNKTLSIKSEVDFKVTESIGGLIMSRLDKLTPTLHLIVRVASVIGNEFEVPILLEAYPVVKGGYLSQPEWKESLAALEKLEVFKRASDKQNTFMFTHPLICDAAYNLLLIEQRRELHRACAIYYETHYATDLSGYYPLLAHHWKMAETDIQKIVYYLEKAGYQAWSNSSSSEVIEFFGELSDMVNEHHLDYDPVHVSEWEWALAISHFQYYRNRKSREYLISIINKLDPPGLPKYGLPLLVAKQIAGFLWDFKWNSPAPPPIKDSYENRRVALASQAWRYVAILSIFLQEPSLAVYACNRSVTLAQRIENTDHYPKSLSLMAMIWAKINKAYSEDAFKRSLEIAEKRQDDPHCRMVVSLWSGYNNFNNGQLEIAYTQVYEARKLAAESGDNRTAEDSLFTLSMIQLLRGHVSESMRFVREDDTLTNLRGSYSMRSNCLAVKARILSLSNRLELAVQAIQDAKHFVTEGFLLDDVIKLIIYGVYAQVFAMKADLEGTLEGARSVYEILVKNKEILNVIPLFGVVYAYYVVVKLFEQQTRFLESEVNATLLNIPRARAASLGTRQQTQELINTLKTYIKVFRGVILEGCKVYPVVRPVAYHTEGLYQWYLCDHTKALELWNQGLQCANDFVMPLEKERLEKELKHRKRCKICKFVA